MNLVAYAAKPSLALMRERARESSEMRSVEDMRKGADTRADFLVNSLMADSRGNVPTNLKEVEGL